METAHEKKYFSKWLWICLFAFIGLYILKTLKVFKIAFPNQDTFLNFKGEITTFSYPKDTVSIYQTQCQSREELMYFLIACAKFKQITDTVNCKLVVIVKKPKSLSDSEFWSILRNDMREEYVKYFPHLKTELRELEVMVDFQNIHTSRFSNNIYATAIYRVNDKEIRVGSCNLRPVKISDSVENIVFSYDLLKMVDAATQNQVSKLLLSEGNGFLKALIGYGAQPDQL